MTRLPPARADYPVLLAFTLVAGVTQLVWLNFAPMLAYVMARYGVGELEASSLVLVFPLLYVFLSVHAGAAIDRLGYAPVVGRGALATAAFAGLRVFDDHFAVLLIAQLGMAVAQPYVVNGIAKVVTQHFDERHGAMATGIGTIGMFVGMAVSMAATPALVASVGLRATMAVFAVVALVSALLFVAVARRRAAPADAGAVSGGSVRALLRRRDLLPVFALAFLGLGFFNGLTTWLEQILAPNGIDAERAGLVGGVLILGGIVGSAVIPAIADRVGRRKPFVLACTAVAAAAVLPLCTSRDFVFLLGLGGAVGFFFLPAYALLIDLCGELAGPAAAGNAMGILMLAGNAGGVVVIVAMPLVRGDAPDFLPAVWLLFALLVLGLAIGARLTDPARSAAPSSAR